MNKKKISLGALLTALLVALGIYAPPVTPPAPTPTPTATVTATATPEPSSSPTALPTPPPPVESCDLPPSDGACVFPPTVPAKFRHAIEDAQASVPREYFDDDGKVKDEHRYVLEVARRVRINGLCAIQGTTVADEVWAKDSNGFSEHWDIVRADNQPITMYAARCSPAKF